jgi:hypothetical protein
MKAKGSKEAAILLAN